MRTIQKGKAYSRIQLTPQEIECIHFALMTQIAATLSARQRTSVDATLKALESQLQCELDLSNQFDNLRKDES